MSAVHAADFAVVTSERGDQIQERLNALGITDRQWHDRTGIDRKTLRRAINGDAAVRANTYRQIEDWLTRLEKEKGSFDGPTGETEDPHVVTFKLSGNFGVDVAVSGPVENIDELRATVEKLIRGMGQRSTDSEES